MTRLLAPFMQLWVEERRRGLGGVTRRGGAHAHPYSAGRTREIRCGDQCVLNQIRGMVEKSLRIEATTRIRPRFCNCGGRNQTGFGGSMIMFYLFRFTTGVEASGKA